jgi:hypothetical protein
MTAAASVFISHRAEYGRVARSLKKAIEATSQGMLEVFISEDIPRGNEWRASIEKHLREAESLFLLYGAAYEDWSWCFYETGYFAAVEPKGDRRIYCLTRPDVPAPGPLSHLQMVTGKEALIRELIDIYQRHNIEFDAVDLRTLVAALDKSLFSPLREFDGYQRVHLTATDADFDKKAEIPTNAMLIADDNVLGDLFTIQAPAVAWSDIAGVAATPEGDQNFMSRWIDETTQIVLAARKNKFMAPQTVLIGRCGRRFRTLLYRARTQADGVYACEFLVMDEVGGPMTGLSSRQLALLTGIRMGYRFRSEVIQKFSADIDTLAESDRCARTQEIPRVIESLLLESSSRGNVSTDDFLAAFEDDESDRMRDVLGYWPLLKRELYRSLGRAENGKTVLGPGLASANDVSRYRTAFEGLRLMNLEFLSRCSARLSQTTKRSDQELAANAQKLEQTIRTLARPDLKSAA